MNFCCTVCAHGAVPKSARDGDFLIALVGVLANSGDLDEGGFPLAELVSSMVACLLLLSPELGAC